MNSVIIMLDVWYKDSHPYIVTSNSHACWQTVEDRLLSGLFSRQQFYSPPSS